MSKTILITGAGSGFGEGIAFKLAELTDLSVIATTENYAQIFRLEQKAQKLNLSNITFEKLDVTNSGDREKVPEWDVDILLNNAGISEGGSVLDIPASAIERQFQTNIVGPIALTQIAARRMLKRKSGRIIFMSSVAGLTVDPFSGAYSASKHAVEAFAEALYKETRPFNIDVITINPGPFLTGFNDRMFETYRGWGTDVASRVFDYQELNFPHEQYDPQIVINETVKIILDENPKYRNVLPKSIEGEQRKQLDSIWNRQAKDGIGQENNLVITAKKIHKETPKK
ncbi:SDR family oxidoreductase [Leuconostoc pseudomesenteroides]|uniref:SDR family oxidoreductase n=1 Tax=Leuconostoc pseudomesenteroides TaxID=33968 RepID=UPI0021A74405|nr:SDR family oxidoreductase [Leuconostoc pseudomesenteroides]MCT4414204.1 SDR family oxidoreductase [Leuconostoc pseudomesenteroides]